jgi:hypothetical protein
VPRLHERRSDVPCKAVGARLSSDWQPDIMRATKERTGISFIHICTGWRKSSSRNRWHEKATKTGPEAKHSGGKEKRKRRYHLDYAHDSAVAMPSEAGCAHAIAGTLSRRTAVRF